MKLRYMVPILALVAATACERETVAPVSTIRREAAYVAGGKELDIEYCSVDGVSLKMDAYYAKAAVPKPAPVVIAVHGGQWVGGNKGSSVLTYDLTRWTKKVTGFSVDYRLGKNIFPAYVQDVQCAIQHVIDNAALYQIDPNKIVLLGHSAGAHIAMYTAIVDPRVKAVIGYAGPYNLAALADFDTTVAREITETFTDLSAASPINQVHADAPPVLVVHGTLDESIALVQAQNLCDALSANCWLAPVPLPLTADTAKTQFIKVVNGGHYLTVPSKYNELTASPSRQAISVYGLSFVIEKTK